MPEFCYRVRDWSEHYEKRHTESEVAFRWIALPTKHDGKGFKRLARQRRRIDAYCGWCLILQVAAKMPVRGTLCDEDGPLDAEDLADATGFPPRVFESAFEILTDPKLKIHWLEKIDATEALETVRARFHGSAGRDKSRLDCDKSPYRTGQDSTGHKRTKHNSARAKRGAGENADEVADTDRRAALASTGEKS